MGRNSQRGFLVSINGELHPAEEAKISVFDAAYLYGEGLFETLVAKKRGVLFFDFHLDRLYRSAKRLGIPTRFSKNRLKKEVYRTLEANGLSEAYIRIALSAEEATVGGRKRATRDAHVVIFTKPPDPYPKHLYTRGVRLILIRSTPNDPLPLAGIKTTNFLSKMVARREIAKRGADEGVLLNTEGGVTECAGSNLFIVKKERLLTPPLREGLLPGVTRRVLTRLARRLKIPFREIPLTIRDLQRADEIFITSTLKGVLPVRSFEGFRKKVPGKITARLSAAYQTSR